MRLTLKTKAFLPRLGALALAAAAALAAACSEEPASKPAAARGAPTTPQSGAARTLDASAPTARISGKVSFVGDAAEPQKVPMGADPYCAKANAGGATRKAYEVGPDGGLAETFVYVTKGLEAYAFPAPETPVLLDQKSCAYVPAVLGVRVGQPLEIRNGDATLHNVHAVAERAGGFNIGMPTQGMTAVRKFQKPEVLVRIKCDVHPWMSAHVGVVEHPYFAVTGPDGSFVLEGLPAGEYTIEAVHPLLGANLEKVRLDPPTDATISFSFSD